MSVVGDHLCRVLQHDEILPGVFRTVLQSGEISQQAKPGQFVQIEPSSGLFPVTRRPFTLNMVYDDSFEIIFDVVGRGTSIMAGMEIGGSVRVMGPLGTGWNVDNPRDWMLIGGGLGAAGFQFLIHHVECRTVVIGAASSNRLLPVHPSCGVLVATEDGSAGKRGLVTDLISNEALAEAECIALCGPLAMMEAVWRTLSDEHRGKVQVSTESRMGCGWGVCDGCSIPVVGGGYRKCCQEGPVFRGVEIDWTRWREAGL